MAKAKTKGAGGELLMVQPGKMLLWPPPIHGLRGEGGTVVPRDDPLLNHRGCNQYADLRAAPAGATVTPHGNKRARALYAELGYDGVPYVEGGQAHAPAAPAAAPPPVAAGASGKAEPPKEE